MPIRMAPTMDDVSLMRRAAAPGSERRAHARVRFSARAHVRGGIGTLEAFEDFANSVDITRGGLLMSTARGNYWVGQALEVTCPYWNNPTAINTPRMARVVRSSTQAGARHDIAVQFEDRCGNISIGETAVARDPNQVRILCVESDPKFAGATCALLQNDGYQVVSVSNARQALDVLATEIPDAILAEVENGDFSGQDLCAAVKKDERLRHVPVILLTNSALPSDYSASHRLGAVVCMTKPCHPVRLQHAVHLVAPPPAQRSAYSAQLNISAFVRNT
jgi:CheY-like chemotaxis protein